MMISWRKFMTDRLAIAGQRMRSPSYLKTLSTYPSQVCRRLELSKLLWCLGKILNLHFTRDTRAPPVVRSGEYLVSSTSPLARTIMGGKSGNGCRPRSRWVNNSNTFISVALAHDYGKRVDDWRTRRTEMMVSAFRSHVVCCAADNSTQRLPLFGFLRSAFSRTLQFPSTRAMAPGWKSRLHYDAVSFSSYDPLAVYARPTN